MDEMTRIRFAEIDLHVPAEPGLYEIHTLDGQALKVGIGKNLRKRLDQHYRSRQSRLVLKAGGDWSNPRDVESKQSILTKHLFFAKAEGYDLKSEAGRRAFLEERCYILFRTTATREEARELERRKEVSGGFRFVGLTDSA